MDDEQFGLLAVFDRDTQEAMRALYGALEERGIVGTQTKDVPYHLTLGMVAPGRCEELRRGMDGAAERLRRISFCLAHVGLFGLRVLFLAPNMNEELLDLQREFFPACVSGCHPWAAHATLLIDEEDAIARAVPIVAQRFRPMRARIERLELYGFAPAQLVKAVALAEG